MIIISTSALPAQHRHPSYKIRTSRQTTLSTSILPFLTSDHSSTTRNDAFFGDNHSFNETLFDEVRPFYSNNLHNIK